MSRFRNLDAKLCFENGGDFKKISLPEGGLAFLRAGCDCPGLREALAKPDTLFDSAGAIILKDSRSSKVAIAAIPGLGKVFIKKHNNKGLRYTLRHLFRKSRAFRTWQSAWLLEQIGVPTPRPIAAISFRKAMILHGSYLIAEAVDGLLHASDFVPRLLKAEGQLDAFLATVFKHMALMHDCGIMHGDMKFSNIAATKDAKGAGIVFAGFIDLDSMKRQPAPLPERARRLELARLAASLTAIAEGSGLEAGKERFCERIAKLYEEAGGPGIAPKRISDATEQWLDKK